ncbi:GNAT family N-acetyltransferase [uncultured Sphingomonas sp.]|uniref:GNAT family N-acetyltransferase n=1 Tax=uncultured Sphingomonas sp. TaxID=158754 RepID=UPI0025FD2C1F|nr:GNAT family N-acetyltransferase [uncultured Sphingomonas sp.]
MTLTLIVPDMPDDSDREAVLAPLRAHNVAHAGDACSRPVAILLADVRGARVGGLWGRCSYGWLFVEYLAVPEAYRGADHGTALMARAEQIARAQGCVGIWLDTFSFQARGFYEKLGFTLYGQIDDFPPGHQRFFLQKRLA